MSGYRRIVSYLYKYVQGKKTENTGFVRVENREDGLRLQFHLKDLKMMDERSIKIYFYFHEEDRIKTIFVDEFICQRGNCEYKKAFPLEEEQADLNQMNGILFLENQNLLYGSCWDDREISEGKIDIREITIDDNSNEKVIVTDHIEEKIDIPEQQLPEEAPLKSNEVQTEIQTKPQMEMQSPMETLLRTFTDKIILKDNPNFIEAVKIDLADISKLSYKDWKLAENAFLRQGYETHGYLLYGKIELQPNQIIWILGVPGTYDNREKYLANMFGFFDYIPEADNRFRTGGKGYWMMRLTEIIP